MPTTSHRSRHGHHGHHHSSKGGGSSKGSKKEEYPYTWRWACCNCQYGGMCVKFTLYCPSCDHSRCGGCTVDYGRGVAQIFIPIESKNPTTPQRGSPSRPSRPTAEPCPTYPIPIPLSKWAEALRLYDVYTVFRDKEDASQGHSPATSVNDGLVDKSSHSSSLLVSILSGKINTRSTLILSNI